MADIWYFRGDGGACYWSVAGNWNSAADGSGSSPTYAPWTHSTMAAVKPAVSETLVTPVIDVDIGDPNGIWELSETDVDTKCDMTVNVVSGFVGTIWGGWFGGGLGDIRGTVAGGKFGYYGYTVNYGTIIAGTWECAIDNRSAISGGAFSGTVELTSNGTISGGTFTGDVTNTGGTISGGVFNSIMLLNSGNIVNQDGNIPQFNDCSVVNQNGGAIFGGYFSQGSFDMGGGTGWIEGGVFDSCPLSNMDLSRISAMVSAGTNIKLNLVGNTVDLADNDAALLESDVYFRAVLPQLDILGTGLL